MSKPENIPHLPGVYLFKNRNGIVIYIGKAKDLRKRIVTYFRTEYHDWKHAALMRDYASIDYIATKSEEESLLLEAELIQQYQPKYNMLFKEGQPFVYIVFSKDPLPVAAVVRSKTKKGTYFGPFMHKTDARRVLKFLVDTFRLNICNKKMPGGCLRYHLGICAGSCRDDFNAVDYQFRVQLAMNVLKNEQDEFMQTIKDKISYYNSMKEFERSKQLHNYLENFHTIFATMQARYAPEKFTPEVTQVVAPVETLQVNRDLADALQTLLHGQKPIRSIDCFDISHFQSRAIVGSCIRFYDGVPVPNKFRRFLLPTFKQQDDYAALKHIIERRYRDPKELPDLVLVDGGKGQLSVAQSVIGMQTACASLAKREETIYSNTIPDGIHLDLHTEVGKTLIALRDYAHHFAITYHRLVRGKSTHRKF